MDSTDFFNISPTTYENYYNRDEILSNHYNDSRPTYPTSYNMFFNEIRLSIFGIVAVCVGLPCLIWAFYSVHLQRKASGRISAFIILLLLTDLLQLILYPYIVSCLLSLGFYPYPGIIILLVVCLKIFGLHLQSLVALEGVLTLKYPRISARLCSCPCYIMSSIFTIPVMFGLGIVFGDLVVSYVCAILTFGSFLLPACLLVATGIIIYKASPTAANTPVTEPRPDAAVFTVSLVTLLVLYLPFVIFSSVLILNFYISESWLVMTSCLLCLTVISEPLLCVLVCRQNLSAQTKQTRIELNSEQTSV